MTQSRVFVLLLNLFLALSGSLISGCARTNSLYLRDELANSGPIALSPDNPYLAANLFVAHEMEHSDVFRGFVDYRGSPDAIEIRKKTLKPLKIFLFYLDDLEAYSFTEGGDDWLIRGPERIPAKMMTSFLNAPQTGKSPPLAFEGYERKAPARRETKHVVIDDAPLVSPQPFVPEKAAPEKRSKIKQQGTAARDVPREVMKRDPEPTPKAKSPEKPPAILSKKPVAEKTTPSEENLVDEHAVASESSSGDLLHRVTFDGESLRLISAWYTGEAKNSVRIARINGIESAATLKVGQSVRIPRYLLKTTAPLPESALEAEKQH